MIQSSKCFYWKWAWPISICRSICKWYREKLFRIFEVYPNPANEYIYIKSSANDLKINSVEIYELSGKKIYSQAISNLRGETKTIELPVGLKGVYLLKINTASVVITKKLLIESH